MVLPTLARGSGRYGGVTLLPERFHTIADIVSRFPTLGAAQTELRRIGSPTRRSAIVAVRQELQGMSDRAPRLNAIPLGFRPTAETITQSERRFGRRYRYSLKVEVTERRTGFQTALDVMFDDDRLLTREEALAEAEEITRQARSDYDLRLDRIDYTGVTQSVTWLGEPVR